MTSLPPTIKPQPVAAIGARVRGGAAILLLGRLFSGAFGTLIRLIVLANLLGPEELEIFGAAMLTIAFLEVFTQSGLRHAVIQTEDVSNENLNTAWTLQALRGLFLGVLIYFCAPALAAMANRPEAEATIAVLSLSPILSGLASIGVNFLERNLQYGRFVLITTGSAFVELFVSIGFALYSPTAWALVAGRLAACLYLLIMSYLICDTHARPGLSLAKAAKLLSYGIWILVAGLISYALIKGGDYVVLHMLGRGDYGIYFLAYALATLPIMQVVHTVGAVTFSGYSRLKNEIPRLRTAFLKSFFVISTVSFFIATIIIAGARPFETLFLSESYAGAGALIEILAVWGLSRGLGAANTSLFQAIGRPALASVFAAVMLVLFAIAIIPATNAYGITGVAWTLAIVGVVVQPMRYPLTASDLQMSSARIYIRVAAPLTASILAVAAAKSLVAFTPLWHPAAHLILSPLTAILVFLTVMAVWSKNRELDLGAVLTELIPKRLQVWRTTRARNP